MTVTLSPVGGGADIILKTVDMDGVGSEDPVVTITVSGNLTTGTTYDGSIEILNESETPSRY